MPTASFLRSLGETCPTPSRPAGAVFPDEGQGYGTAKMLGWMVDEKTIEPHVPVWDKAERKDGSLGRSDFRWEGEADEYQGQLPFVPEGMRVPLQLRNSQTTTQNAEGVGWNLALSTTAPALLHVVLWPHERIVHFIPHPGGPIEVRRHEDLLLMRIVFTKSMDRPAPMNSLHRAAGQSPRTFTSNQRCIRSLWLHDIAGEAPGTIFVQPERHQLAYRLLAGELGQELDRSVQTRWQRLAVAGLTAHRKPVAGGGFPQGLAGAVYASNERVARHRFPGHKRSLVP